ncbi:S-layer homology domain-containing protein [Bacillus testis]|uniref:S-layer homology domain-containing protein n=1 Tax=Bacillus testis TaxID=1622072 RepID=UPI00067E8171|nr:S-layer homology domain-containing protein [Bacillus testis]
MKRIIFFVLAFSLLYGAESEAASFSDVTKQQRFYGDIKFWGEKDVLVGYSNGTFRPSEFINRGQTAIVLGRAFKLEPNGVSNFQDIKSPVTSSYVAAVVKAGFMTTKDTKNFYPNEVITRSQMAQILSKAFKINTIKPNRPSFHDVDSNTYAFKDIMKVASSNIFTGYPDGSFRPNNPVTRGEMALLLSRGFFPYANK